jgi:hypothetical protein
VRLRTRGGFCHDQGQRNLPRSLESGFHRWREHYHLGLAKQNGVTRTELIEAITHLAFYAGWPKAMSAMTVAKKVFAEQQDQ